MAYSKSGKIMKTLSLSSLLLLGAALNAIFSSAQATTIFEIKNSVNVFSNAISARSGQYYDQGFAGFSNSTPINNAQLSAAVTGSDLTNYAWTPDFHIPKGPAGAYIDLSFADNIYNGEGADLVVFFAGNGTKFKNGNILPYHFTIDIGADSDKKGRPFGVTTTTSSKLYDDKFFASYTMIDLDDFGYDRTTALGDIRIYLGGKTMPALTALGAYHTTTTVVPLPLSAVLFASGLTLLSLFRRKPQQ